MNERLKAAREVLVRVVKTSDDGARFVPLVLRLEREIAARTENEDDYLRILRQAAYALTGPFLPRRWNRSQSPARR